MTKGQSLPYIGGQAVLEGVMMRAPRSVAIVVRRADGRLVVRERAIASDVRPWARWPLVRGVAALGETMIMGREALNFSVEQLEQDVAAAPATKAKGTAGLLSALALAVLAMQAPGEGPVGLPRERRPAAGSLWMLVAPIAIMVALPQGAAATLNRLFHLGFSVQSAAFQAATGAFKLAIVVGMMLWMRQIPEIKRMFQYHGAEHKTVNAYEAGEELTVASARAKTTLHPRCGTTFFVMIALVSILVFTGVGALLPQIQTGSVVLDNLVFFAEKLPCLPLLVGITFELQRVFARYFIRGPLRIVLWPGFLVQKLTTAEPDDAQLEVALASLRATLFRQDGPSTSESTRDVQFPSYEALVAANRLRLSG
jgi:uncharacterized protein YqhQ